MGLDQGPTQGMTGVGMSPADIRQCLLSMESAMRMLGKAIHRFSQLRAVHNELRYDVEWTNYMTQLQQSLANVKEAVGKM